LISSRAIVSSGQYILKIQYFLICSETFVIPKGVIRKPYIKGQKMQWLKRDKQTKTTQTSKD
jgi:hypothetical protein